MTAKSDSDMVQIIKARFMHQYKDRTVYEREIVLDTASLSQYDGKTITYLCFDMPLFFGIEPEFIKRFYLCIRNITIASATASSIYKASFGCVAAPFGDFFLLL